MRPAADEEREAVRRRAGGDVAAACGEELAEPALRGRLTSVRVTVPAARVRQARGRVRVRELRRERSPGDREGPVVARHC